MDELIIRRIDWRTFEVECDGDKQRVNWGDSVPGFPRCFHTIDELFAAGKSVTGCARNICESLRDRKH